MKSLKNHISVILTLLILLFSVQFSVDMYRVIQNQKNSMIQNYSLVIVSQKKLQKEDLKAKVPQIASLSLVSPKKIIQKLKNRLSNENLTLLKIALPYFYSIKLDALPKTTELQSIKTKLQSIKSISRVESFTKSYSRIYRVLQILQIITYIFSSIVAFMSILLLFKQIRIWILEHEEKIKIMGYFGANYWIKSAFLYKLVFIDSLISTALVSFAYIYIPSNDYIRKSLDSLNIYSLNFINLYDIAILFSISLVLSVIIVTTVSRKMAR